MSHDSSTICKSQQAYQPFFSPSVSAISSSPDVSVSTSSARFLIERSSSSLIHNKKIIQSMQIPYLFIPVVQMALRFQLRKFHFNIMQMYTWGRFPTQIAIVINLGDSTSTWSERTHEEVSQSSFPSWTRENPHPHIPSMHMTQIHTPDIQKSTITKTKTGDASGEYSPASEWPIPARCAARCAIFKVRQDLVYVMVWNGGYGNVDYGQLKWDGLGNEVEDVVDDGFERGMEWLVNGKLKGNSMECLIDVDLVERCIIRFLFHSP